MTCKMNSIYVEQHATQKYTHCYVYLAVVMYTTKPGHIFRTYGKAVNRNGLEIGNWKWKQEAKILQALSFCYNKVLAHASSIYRHSCQPFQVGRGKANWLVAGGSTHSEVILRSYI